MVAPVIYFAGGEDECIACVGNVAPVTTVGTFRAGIARCSIAVVTGGPELGWATNAKAFAATTFWTSFQSKISGALWTASSSIYLWAYTDSSGVIRLLLKTLTSSLPAYRLCKRDAAGVETTLGTFIVPQSATLNKMDIQIDYQVAGSIKVYYGVSGSPQALLFSYTGDITTNGVTQLAFLRLSGTYAGTTSYYSEIIITDRDTRSMTLATMAPAANGTTHDFDTGTPAAANVNEIVNSDFTMDGSTTAGQIDGYTVSAIPAGDYGVVAVGVSGRISKGDTGPTKGALGVRTSAAYYYGADAAQELSLELTQNWWTQNPATTAPWLTSQIGSAVGFNIALKSVP